MQAVLPFFLIASFVVFFPPQPWLFVLIPGGVLFIAGHCKDAVKQTPGPVWCFSTAKELFNETYSI